jgi:hypothetical protein
MNKELHCKKDKALAWMRADYCYGTDEEIRTQISKGIKPHKDA